MSQAPTRSGHRRRGLVGSGLTAFAAAALLASTSTARANSFTAQLLCESALAKAAAKYTSCAEKALATGKLTLNGTAYATAAGKCATKYAGAWVTLQAKATMPGTTCDNPRFVDNGDGTVTDQLTALQWEKKTNLDGTANFADPHDADNAYSWSPGFPPPARAGGFTAATAADGTAFTTFLSALNSGGCFAGQCDWRLPTRDELLTIATPAYPACMTGPCIDPAFGPTDVAGSFYWSATTVSATTPESAWGVFFSNGAVDNILKGNDSPVRAVRGGL